MRNSGASLRKDDYTLDEKKKICMLLGTRAELVTTIA